MIKINRFIKAPKLINPVSLPCLYMNSHVSSIGEFDRIKVKKIVDEVDANKPAKIPEKISFLFKMPCF